MNQQEAREASIERARASMRAEMEKVHGGPGPEIGRQVEMLRELLMSPETKQAEWEGQRVRNIAEADTRAKNPEIVRGEIQAECKKLEAEAKRAQAEPEQTLREEQVKAVAIRTVREAFTKARSK